MATSAIEGVLVPGCLALASNSRNSGVTVNKGGYHSTRNWLKTNQPDDYSIQLPADKLGPGDEGSAFDWSFDDARLHSDFKTIAKFSTRLYEAGQRKDPRAYPMREFQGNIDSDRTVEGWSYYRDHALTTSDLTHLWHIHFSIWRKHINDPAAMRSILSILSGEEEDDMSLTAEDLLKIRALVKEEVTDKIRTIVRSEVALVWEADVIPNVWNPENPGAGENVRAKNALANIGRDTKPPVPPPAEPPTP